MKSSSYPTVKGLSATPKTKFNTVSSSTSRSLMSNQERYAHLIKLEDGKVRCTLCNSIYSCLVSARAHTVRVHEQPDYFECCFCKRIFRTKLNFRSHLNLSHGVKGSNLVASYGRLVDPSEFSHADATHLDQDAFLDATLVEPDIVIDQLWEIGRIWTVWWKSEHKWYSGQQIKSFYVPKSLINQEST